MNLYDNYESETNNSSNDFIHNDSNDDDDDDDTNDQEPFHHDDDDDDENNEEPYLVQCLRNQNWNEALKRIASHTHETQWRGGDNETILHATFSQSNSIRNVPLQVIQTIIDTCGPEIISQQKNDSTNVLSIILLEWHNAQWQTGLQKHRLPHLARRDVIQTLVRYDPSVVSFAPIHRLFHIWEYCYSETWRGRRNALKKAVGNSFSPSDLSGNVGVLFWMMDLLLFVKEYKRIRSEQDPPYCHLLHSILAVRGHSVLPVSFYKLAVQLSPDQACRERDQFGRTPLTMAVCTPSYQWRDGHPASPIIQLLQKSPGTAHVTNENGRLPLHLAIERGHRTWEKGIEAIVLDAPKALGTRDIKTRLYPFMLAAVRNYSDLNTVYELLRQDPLCARGMAVGLSFRNDGISSDNTCNLTNVKANSMQSTNEFRNDESTISSCLESLNKKHCAHYSEMTCHENTTKRRKN